MLPDVQNEGQERIFNIQQWTEFDEGGHFAATEKPELPAGDIRTFFKTVGKTGSGLD